jgi:hypothetical protein
VRRTESGKGSQQGTAASPVPTAAQSSTQSRSPDPAARASASAAAASASAAQALAQACTAWNVEYLSAIQAGTAAATRAAQVAWEATWTAKMPTACAPTAEVTTALLSAQQVVGAREDAANAPVPTTAAPRPIAPAPAPAPVSVYFSNCAEARAAGAAPLHRGDPGYRSGLDRDNDGVACE